MKGWVISAKRSPAKGIIEAAKAIRASTVGSREEGVFQSIW